MDKYCRELTAQVAVNRVRSPKFQNTLRDVIAAPGQYSTAKSFLDYVCVWPDGKLISPDYVTRHFPIVLKQNSLRSIRFHDLKHTCASLLVAAGIPMKMIQEWLGHSVYQTTANLYSHLAVDTKNTVAETLAGQLIGNGTEATISDQNH
jgi:integrase